MASVSIINFKGMIIYHFSFHRDLARRFLSLTSNDAASNTLHQYGIQEIQTHIAQ